MNLRHPVLNSFSIKNIFQDKMDLKAFLFSCDEIPFHDFCDNFYINRLRKTFDGNH